jgi:hypothetical protein
MSEQDKSKVAEQQVELDKAIMGGNIGAINAELEAEAKKQGVDLSKPRNEKGQYAKAEAALETAAKADPEEPVVYKMTVELAPGQSIVVEADSQEACKLKADLAQKAAEAVLAAAKPKEASKQEEKKPALTADELFDIGTKLQSGKVEAIDEYLEKNPAVFEKFLEKKGVKVDDLKEIVTERRSTREVKSWEDATAVFKEAHPDFVPSDLGRDLMGYKLAELGLGAKPSIESLEAAYDAVKTKYPTVFQKTETETTQTVVKKKAESSALFGLGGGSDTRPTRVDPSKVKVNLTAEQFNSMKPEQLAAWYNSQMAEATGQKAPY